VDRQMVVFRDRVGEKAVPLTGNRDADDAFGKINKRLLSRREAFDTDIEGFTLR